MSKQTESQLQDEIRLALNHPAMVTFRNNVGVAEIRGTFVRFGLGNPGGSDLVGVFRGRAIFIEIKTPIGRQSAEQRQFERLVTSKGAIYVVLRSVEDARELLMRLERTVHTSESA